MSAALLVVLSLAGPPQVPPPPPPPTPSSQASVRDPGMRQAPDLKGTGTIRGRVVAADTGNPIRRANVSLSMTAPPAGVTGASPVNFARPRSATTDMQGAFEFRDLPPGSYRLFSSPGQYAGGYLAMAYGARRPNAPGSSDPGTTINLADAQTLDKVIVALPRGAVISGRVTDENGEALARVQVYTLMYPSGSSRGTRSGTPGQTDDLGQFRIYGLAPGDYAVVAEARGNTFVSPNAPPETEEDKIGFLTTFYPGSPDEAGAQRVRAKAASETPGVEIRLVSGRLFHVSGVVTDSQGRFVTRSTGMLSKRGAASPVMTTFGFPVDDQGRFQMRNIPPGNYRLTIRQQPAGPRNPDGTFVDPGEFASMPMTITSDLDDVLVVTSPGATITGNVMFETGPPQLNSGQQSFQMRVNAMIGDPEGMMGAPTPPPALVTPDFTFTMKGLAGELLLRGGVPDAYLKAVLLGGDDITDTPREFKTGDRVTMVYTTRAATLEGTVTDAAGRPAPEASLMLFSEDKGSWRMNSIRTRRSGTDQSGHFKMMGVLPGRYFMIAMTRERSNGLNMGPGAADASVFEALSKEATPVVVGEDEQRQVDVRISAGGGA